MAITFKITSFVEYVYRAPTRTTANTWHLAIVSDILEGRRTWATEMQLDKYELITNEVLASFTVICKRGDSKFVATGTFTRTTSTKEV